MRSLFAAVLLSALTVFGGRAHAFCEINDPFPFPLGMTLLQEMQGHWIYSKDESIAVQFQVFNGGNSHPFLSYDLRDLRANKVKYGNATYDPRRGFCDHSGGTPVCFSVHNRNLLITVEGPKQCLRYEFKFNYVPQALP